MELTLQPPAESLVTAPASPPRPPRLPVALGLAVLSGAALLLSLPPYAQWWLAPVGVAGIAAAAHRRRLRGGAGIGFIAGLVLFVPLLDWTRLAAGWLPWMLLSFAQAGIFALLGLGGALVDTCVAFARRAGYRRMRLWTTDPLVAARRIYLARGFRLVESAPHDGFGVALVGQTYVLEL